MAIYAGQFGPEGLEFSDGEHAVLTRVTVYKNGVEAVLYNDRDKTAIAANPVSTDYLGNLVFFAEPGNYELAVDGLRVTVQVPVDPLEPIAGRPDPRYMAYTHEQLEEAADWIVTHPLPFTPAGVQVTYSEDPLNPVAVPIEYLSDGVVIIHNGVPSRGRAILS